MAPQNSTSESKGLDILDQGIAITTQLATLTTGINAFIPLGEFAIRKLFEIFKRDNPQLTPQQFYEYLRTQGRVVKAFSREWLLAHGYQQDASGVWHPPAESPAPAQPIRE